MKMYKTILKKGIRQTLDNIVVDKQSEFRNNYSVQRQILMEKALKKNKNVYLHFINREKAFNSMEI